MDSDEPAWMQVDLEHEDPRDTVTAGWKAIDLGGPEELVVSVVWPGLVRSHDQYGAAAAELAGQIAQRPDRPELIVEALSPLSGCESALLLLPAINAALDRDATFEMVNVKYSVLRSSGAPQGQIVALLRRAVTLAAADERDDVLRTLMWHQLQDHDADAALVTHAQLEEAAPMDTEFLRLAAAAIGDTATAEAHLSDILGHFDGDTGRAAVSLAWSHHDMGRAEYARAWAKQMTCPPADAPDELIDDYLTLVHSYGIGATATPQIRASWGDTIPETARVMVARVFKQFDADLAATALRQAYEVASAPGHIATLKFDQAALAGDWQQAEEHAAAHPQMLLWIVPLSGDVEQWERCISRFQELAYRDRGCVTAEFNIPMARGDLAAARALADEIERYYPDGDSATERHALLDALQGNLPLARANVEIALRKDPTCNVGIQVACLIEALDGNWERAVELAELAYEYKDPFYVAEVELVVLEAHRGGDLLEEVIGWHQGVVHDAPYEPFYAACRAYAAATSA